MAETRIGVIGCGGRMGRMLIADIVASEGCGLSGGLARSGSACLGQDLGELAGIGRIGLPAAARGVAFDEVAQRGRDGITGPRAAGAIGFAALRGGDNIGEHHVIFAGIGERLELVHRATNRAIYAKGAVRAARWLVARPPGLYGMKEVLGL